MKAGAVGKFFLRKTRFLPKPTHVFCKKFFGVSFLQSRIL